MATASLFHLPYLDGCFDVVYTSQAIEPNAGNEAIIMKELYRVTSRFLVLLEPAYELASQEAQQRMEKYGYCRGLVEHAKSMGMRVIKHELLPYVGNPLNPIAITVIEKNSDAPSAIPQWACPRFGLPLRDYGDSFFCTDSLRAYPKIQGIPCLRPEDGIIASTYEKYKNKGEFNIDS